LAVEEHFYLVLPPVLIFLRWRRGGGADPFRPILYAFAVVAAVGLWLRWEQAGRAPYSHKTHLFPTHLRLDALWFGVAIAYLHHFRRESLAGWTRRWERVWVLAAVLLMVPPFVFRLEDNFFLPTAGFSCLYLAGGLLICVLLENPLPRNRLVRLVAWIGFYSYSIYLWHFFVLRVTCGKWMGAEIAGRPPWGLYLLYLAGSVLTGVLMAKVVECPFLALRDRLFPSRSGPGEQEVPKSSSCALTEAQTS
jgi:peptidoglycan/LPS O-acetylase OafA/YrhL